MMCVCGHDKTDHADSLGRCAGQCHDTEYGTFTCLCHAWRDAA